MQLDIVTELVKITLHYNRPRMGNLAAVICNISRGDHQVATCEGRSSLSCDRNQSSAGPEVGSNQGTPGE